MTKAWVRLACGLGLMAYSPLPADSTPLGTGFTYQGQLVMNGSPVNGTTTLRFSLWDAAGSGSPPTGGNQIGANQIVPNVAVENGLFFVELDAGGQFGPNAFNGDARWLQVEVCTDVSCATLTTLAPRQPVLASPYARFAAQPWQFLNGNTFTNSSVGIGTSAPTSQLSLGSNNANSKLLLWDDGSPNGLGFGIGPNQFRIHLGLPDNRFSFLDAPAGNELVTILGTGNVGIGTTSPAQKLVVQGNTTLNGNVGIGTDQAYQALTVNGDISLGPNALYRAPAAEENLRIMRGSVNYLGDAIGCCFSVSHPITGTYVITFARPFSDVPTVTASTPWHPGYHPRVYSNITTVNDAQIVVEDKDGNFINWGFDFIAAGPR